MDNLLLDKGEKRWYNKKAVGGEQGKKESGRSGRREKTFCRAEGTSKNFFERNQKSTWQTEDSVI